MNMKSILEKMFGESSCGPVRLSLIDYLLEQSVFRDMCKALLQCSSEADFVKLLMLDGENAILFMFYYAGSCPNVSLGMVSALLGKHLHWLWALSQSYIMERKKAILRARGLDLTSLEGLLDILSFLSDLISKLQCDNSFSSIDNLRKLRESICAS